VKLDHLLTAESTARHDADDPVSDILADHGISDSWIALEATGIANRIYATRNVVLRIATDHPDAVPDARTESVAAPVARAAGLPVPSLLAFDDSRRLIDRPYSLWERVRGETLGVFAPAPESVPDTWRAVGRELAELHTRVSQCPDPHGWLDQPERDMTVDHMLATLDSRLLPASIDAAAIEEWIRALRPLVVGPTERRFLHNDVHAMNLMCARDASLLAIIDWGDAGWGDPVLEFAQVPLAAVPFVLEGYRDVAPALLGERPEARILWDQLTSMLEDLEHGVPRHRPDELRQFARDVLHRRQ
jgi:aminoglycoside phosphotransferase (APT) family kinase protein